MLSSIKLALKATLAIFCAGAATSSSAQWTQSGNNITTPNFVGIGNANPSASLDVFTGGAATPQHGLLVHSASFVNMTNAQASYLIKTIDEGSGSPNFLIRGDGLVSIGSGNPASRLDVFMPGSPNPQQGLLLHCGSFINGTNAHASYFIKAQDDGLQAPQFIVHGDGATGIFSDVVPGYALSVNGAGIFNKVVVKTNIFADYVFDSTYQLPAISKVEQYIKQNHHLPDIPSADSVAKSGLDISVNQTALLKKIEELTLYIIEQDKNLEQMRKELTDQKNVQQEQAARLDRLERLLINKTKK